MKANLLAIFLILITSASAVAAAAPPPSYYQGMHQGRAPAQQAAEPAQLLKAGVSKLTGFIRSGGAKDQARAAAFLRGMESHNELHGHAMEPWVRGAVGEMRSRLEALLDEADPIPLETDDLPAAKAELASLLESLLE